MGFFDFVKRTFILIFNPLGTIADIYQRLNSKTFQSETYLVKQIFVNNNNQRYLTWKFSRGITYPCLWILINLDLIQLFCAD